MSKKYSIAIMGENQIDHLIPILKEKYNIVNLNTIFTDTKKTKLMRRIEIVKQLIKCDVLYNVYTYKEFYKIARLAKLCGTKVFTHWIGTDALEAVNVDIKEIRKNVTLHFACFKGISDELKAIDIDATVLPIVPFNYSFKLSKMPNEHAVLIYMPTNKEDFYGKNFLEKVWTQFPELDFHIVGNTNNTQFSSFKNVISHGVLSKDQMEQLYDNISVIIRIPRHDGLSMSVLEGLVKGKYVIWNYEFPFCYYANNAEQISKQLDLIINDSPCINTASNEYITSCFTANSFIDVFDSELKKYLK